MKSQVQWAYPPPRVEVEERQTLMAWISVFLPPEQAHCMSADCWGFAL